MQDLQLMQSVLKKNAFHQVPDFLFPPIPQMQELCPSLDSQYLVLRSLSPCKPSHPITKMGLP